MRQLLEIFKALLLIALLTLVTQVGGLVYLIYKPIGRYIQKRNPSTWVNWFKRVGLFVGLYLFASLFIIPFLAPLGGRVALPLTNDQLKPAYYFYCLANRHYVKPALRKSILEVADQMPEEVVLVYLDANFPFWDGFPLLPHLSHNDGKKLDLVFIYRNRSNQKLANRALSWLGYGLVEGPQSGEHDQPKTCASKGYWQYNLLSKFTPQYSVKNYQFDVPLNKKLIQQLSRQARIQKIFIEPHLKTRLGLQSNSKVRFHGCQAVRHDDHIHIQL